MNATRDRRRMAALMAGVVVTALLIGACSGRGEEAKSVLADSSIPAPTGQSLATRTAGGSSAAAPSPAGSEAFGAASTVGAGQAQTSPLPPGIGSPKVVKTAVVEVEVKAGGFDKAFSRVATIAATHGGFVASSSSSRGSGDDGRQAAGNLVVRVPAEAFDAARRDLIDLGDLRSQQLQGDDVGAQVADIEARLRNLRSQEEAMRLLMTKATNVGETIEVQRQLSGVREQIEQLSAQLARLNDAVAYSTLTLSLAEPGAAVRSGDEGSPVIAAFGRALDGAEAVLGAAIVSLGYLVPLALLLALGWLAVRPVFRLRRVEP